MERSQDRYNRYSRTLFDVFKRKFVDSGLRLSDFVEEI
jgi:hypothetical protein